MNIAVCEDQPADALHLYQTIESYCRQHSYTNNISVYNSGEALLTDFCPGRYQIIFLDIFLDDMTGLETARRIRKTDEDCAIIFTTVSRDYGVESYSVNASYYLVKPISAVAFASAMQRCQWLLEKHNQSVEVMVNRSLTRLLLKDIMYIEAFGKFCEIHMTSYKARSYIPLHKMHNMLSDAFVRCHRSYVINLHYVNSITDQEVLLTDHTRVPCSRTFHSAVVTAFRTHIAMTARRDHL